MAKRKQSVGTARNTASVPVARRSTSSGSTGLSQIFASPGSRFASDALEAIANRRSAPGWRDSRRSSSSPA